MIFYIKEKDGHQFARESGDNNKIHLCDLTGYNSIFGNKICHGSLVFLKFLKKIKFNFNKKIQTNINILFIKSFNYRKKIYIKKKKNLYKLYQDKFLKAEIIINNKNFYKEKLLSQNLKFKKIFKYNNSKNIKNILMDLSMYVGKIYPGENSMIREINIFYSKKNNYSNNQIKIFSRNEKKIKLIRNQLILKNFYVSFETYIRPKLIKKKIKPNKTVLKKAKELKEDILIIGGSSGIGSEIVDVFKNNKKINIYATYNKNKMLDKKNVRFFQFNIYEKSKIIKILKKIKINRVYYFATPKININNPSKEEKIKMKKFFLNFVLNICDFLIKKQITLFYPSTKYINNNLKDTDYAKIKLNAENKLIKKFSSAPDKLRILRIDEVNTRQNLNFFYNKKKNEFLNFLNKDKEYQSKIF